MTGKQKLIVCLFVAALLSPLPGGADTIDDQLDPDTVEEPTFSSPAQAMHAAQLAEAAAMQPNEETQQAVDDLAAARDAFDEAQAAYQAGIDDPTADLAALQEAIDNAAQSLDEARNAYAEQIGALAGVYGEEIQAMRQNGFGWGQIAHELGVHPGVLGLGHGKRTGVDPVDEPDDPAGTIGPSDLGDEIAAVTQRSAKAAGNPGRGVAMRDRAHAETGVGLSHASNSAAAAATGSAGTGGKGLAGAPGQASGRGNSAASGNRGTDQGNSGNGLGAGATGSSSDPGSSGKSGGPGNSGKGDDGPGNSGKGNDNGKGKGNDNGNAGGRGGGVGGGLGRQ